MNTIPCVPGCCSTTPLVQIPGLDGTNGATGAAGVNARSVTTGFSIPALVSQTVVAPVDTVAWMVIGAIVVAGATQSGGSGGPATFQIVNFPTSTSVTLQWLKYPSDAAGGTAIGSQSIIVPAGPLAALTLQTPQILTIATGAAISIGSDSAATFITSAHISITYAGLYMIRAGVRVLASAATLTTQILTLELRNGATPITGASVVRQVLPITTTTGVIADVDVISYTTFAALDDLRLYATFSSAPGAGAVYIDNLNIIAVPLFLA